MDKSLIEWFIKSPITSSDFITTDKLVSGFMFFGTNTSDPNASILEMFQNSKNHVDATFSIIGKSGSLALFDPENDSLKEAASTYQSYMTRLGTFPGFNTIESYKIPIKVTNDIQSLKDQITEDYFNDKENDIKNAIDKLIGSILSFEHSGTYSYMATHTIVTIEETGIMIYVARMMISVPHNKIGMIYIGEQSTYLEITKLQVNSTYITLNASQLADMITTKYTYDQIVKSITTPSCI